MKIVQVAAAAAAATALATAAAAGDLGVDVKFDRPAPIYAPKDLLSLTVSSQRDVRIEILLIDRSGRVARIFPAAGHPAYYLGGGRSIRIPAQGGFPVSPPAGRYELRVIAKAAPDPGATRSIGHADARLADRDIEEDHKLFFTVE